MRLHRHNPVEAANSPWVAESAVGPGRDPEVVSRAISPARGPVADTQVGQCNSGSLRGGFRPLMNLNESRCLDLCSPFFTAMDYIYV